MLAVAIAGAGGGGFVFEKDYKAIVAEVVPAGTTATVNMTDDSSWSGYVAGGAPSYYKGVFIKNRSVTLSPYAMWKYEVTQELFAAVMGENPSYFNGSSSSKDAADGEIQELRPVERVSWYDAIAFCNKLSILAGFDPCYTVLGVDFETLTYAEIPTTNNDIWNAATCDFTKKGYRLPTEAEWEYAARGGKDSATWGYSYSGVDTAKQPGNFSSNPYNDSVLEAYAWYDNNSGNKTHEVGLKKPNSLGLYDMSGNVYEWCWDWYSNTVSAGTVTDPKGANSGTERLFRGGSWSQNAYYCAVSYRNHYEPYHRNSYFGFRLARSL